MSQGMCANSILHVHKRDFACALPDFRKISTGGGKRRHDATYKNNNSGGSHRLKVS